MIKKLKPYFIKWFKTGIIILSIVLIFKTIAIGDFKLSDLKIVLILIGLGATFISLSCGIAEYYFIEVWRPNKIKKILKKTEFQNLTKLGFKLENDGTSITGDVKEYRLTILPTINGDNSRWVTIMVFIFVKPQQFELLEKLPENCELGSTEQIIWLQRNIRIKMFRYPSLDNFKLEIKNLIDFLRERKIEPVIFEEN